MRKKTSKMLKEEADALFSIIPKPPAFDLNEALEEVDYELSKLITSKIVYAVENNLDVVNIAKVVMPHGFVVLKSSKKNFVETLEVNIEKLIKYEDYENCSICQKCLESLKQQSI